MGMTLRDRKVVVLTGATGVIGREIAEGLFRANFAAATVSRLVLIVHNEGEGEAVAAPLRSDALRVDVLVADLASMAQVAQCAARIRDMCGTVDVAILNAAAAPKERPEDVDLSLIHI